MEDEAPQSYIEKINNHVSKRALFRGFFFGTAGFIIFLEVQKIGGTTFVWGVSGALAGIAVPVIWDAFKKQKDEEKAFQIEVDARFDRLEQRLPSFMTHGEIDTLRADIGIARADCERALEISKFSSDTARTNQERINDIISSGVIFQLTQDLTVLRIQYAILKKIIQKQKVNLDDIDDQIHENTRQLD
jgi:hypothetical protein